MDTDTADCLCLVQHILIEHSLLLVLWLGIDVDAEKFPTTHLHRIRIADGRIIIQIKRYAIVTQWFLSQSYDAEFGFLDKNKQKVDFLAYFRTKAREKYEKWDCVYNHFEKFVGGKCTFGDVTVELCEKFRDYLLKCKQINHPNAYISRNSAAGYYSTFRALLKIAYKEKMLRENLNDFLEKIEWKEVKKEYLTLDEVKKLAATPCKIPVLKQASLFACMTGLRISDILKLDWHDFEVGPDQGYYIRICTEKTETEATLPISQEALELCGEWGTGKVFKGLTRSMTHHPLKQWIAEAGIRKHITFHCFRHSYAVIQISLGTDIYTVSKMLTHKNVTTTQIYADLVNSKKRETANKISLK